MPLNFQGSPVFSWEVKNILSKFWMCGEGRILYCGMMAKIREGVSVADARESTGLPYLVNSTTHGSSCNVIPPLPSLRSVVPYCSGEALIHTPYHSEAGVRTVDECPGGNRIHEEGSFDEREIREG